MYALRVAAATDRVLLLRWEHPGNLTDFLVPGSRLDWRWEGTPAAALLAADRQLKSSNADKDVFGNGDLGRTFPNAEFFTRDPSNKIFLVLKTNFPAEQKCVMCPGVLGKPHDGYDYVCMFRYLFKPSPLVERKTDEYLHSLYPTHIPSNSSGGGSSDRCAADGCSSSSSSDAGLLPADSDVALLPGSSSSSSGSSGAAPFAYQAVHLRLGMMQGEDSVVNRISGYVDPLAKFLLAVSCGGGMAAKAGINVTATPLLLLADHRGVRQFSRHGKLANVVTPAYEAVHTKMNSVEAHLLSFVDLNLIARAKCAVLSHSGFSNVGWWLSGGNSCRMMLAECYKTCAADSSKPYCP